MGLLLFAIFSVPGFPLPVVAIACEIHRVVEVAQCHIVIDLLVLDIVVLLGVSVQLFLLCFLAQSGPLDSLLFELLADTGETFGVDHVIALQFDVSVREVFFLVVCIGLHGVDDVVWGHRAATAERAQVHHYHCLHCLSMGLLHHYLVGVPRELKIDKFHVSEEFDFTLQRVSHVFLIF